MKLKSFLLIAGLMLVQGSAKAEEIYTTVFNVFDNPLTERVSVLSGMDGRIYRTHRADPLSARLKSMIGQVVKLSYTETNNGYVVTNVQLAKSSEVDPRVMDLNHFRYNELRKFAPTDLQSYEQAEEVFNDMLNDGDRRLSQCFKRAHIWSYDMWSKLGINSEKIFIFYTQRYIQLDKKADWWFHVAPMVNVRGEEFVMDGTFMKKPITVNEWKSYFIKSQKITCPIMEAYQTYENNQWNRLCFLMKVPMYYFSPRDIEMRDVKSINRNHWILEELQDARRAFKGYEKTYEGLDTGKPTIKY